MIGEKDLPKSIEAAKKKDNDAITALYEHMHHKVYFSAIMIVKNENDALDIMQETFITAIKKLHTLKSPDTFEAWLLTVARNKCFDFLKKHREILVEDKGEGLFESIPDNEEFLPEAVLERTDMQEAIFDTVKSLSVPLSQTVMYYYYENLTISEISEIMSCPTGTVSCRLSMARNKIKRALLEHEQAEPPARKERKLAMTAIPILTQVFKNAADNRNYAGCLSSAKSAECLSAVLNNVNMSLSAVVTQTVSEFAATTTGKIMIGGTVVIITASVIAGFMFPTPNNPAVFPAAGFAVKSAKSTTTADAGYTTQFDIAIQTGTTTSAGSTTRSGSTTQTGSTTSAKSTNNSGSSGVAATTNADGQYPTVTTNSNGQYPTATTDSNGQYPVTTIKDNPQNPVTTTKNNPQAPVTTQKNNPKNPDTTTPRPTEVLLTDFSGGGILVNSQGQKITKTSDILFSREGGLPGPPDGTYAISGGSMTIDGAVGWGRFATADNRQVGATPNHISSSFPQGYSYLVIRVKMQGAESGFAVKLTESYPVDSALTAIAAKTASAANGFTDYYIPLNQYGGINFVDIEHWLNGWVVIDRICMCM